MSGARRTIGVRTIERDELGADDRCQPSHSRSLQTEVNDAVQNNRDHADEASERPGRWLASGVSPQCSKPEYEDQANQNDSQTKSQNPSLDEPLQVVIVRVVNKYSRQVQQVGLLPGNRFDVLKRSVSAAENRE